MLEHRAHQGVRRREAATILEPQGSGQPGLVFQVQQVGLLARLQVHRAAHPDQELLRVIEEGPFGMTQQPAFLEGADPVAGGRAGRPCHGVDVA